MAKREFLQLAHKYDSKKYYIGNWMMSEKLDGIRCFWDGGISRGLPAESIPFANVEKDGRYKNQIFATGLWSRLRKTIQAPDWILDQLPEIPLDCELWMESGSWETISSIVKQLNPDSRWAKIKLMILDSPRLESVIDYGGIVQSGADCTIGKNLGLIKLNEDKPSSFERVHTWLENKIVQTDNLQILEQVRLSSSTPEATKQIESYMEEILERGGEGIMLRKHSGIWTPSRSHELLKYKVTQDAEAIVQSYVWGRETDKGSKLMGMLGALVTNYKGKRLELSGFSEDERRMTFIGEGDSNKDEGFRNPGKPISKDWTSLIFPIGSIVTFKYRELSDNGIPKEARFCEEIMNILPIHIKRFWAKVHVKAENECWPWLGAQRRSYGAFWIPPKMYGAHVVAFKIANPEINIVGVVLHLCDNSICVNPKHLAHGTQSQNIKGAYTRGRMGSGENNNYAKLTDKDVLEIRKLKATNNCTHKEIAERWHVSESTIDGIISRRYWKHI